MANEKVSQLPGVSSALATDVIYAIQGGISVQETLSQVLNLGLAFDTLFFNGDPNGNIAGQTYQRCWDTSNNVLWICTTSGSAVTAVWKTTFGTLTDGQLIIGYSGNAPQVSTLTAGTNISIVNGHGNITISNTGASSFVWNQITTTSATLSANEGAVTNNAALVTLTLPATAALGDQIAVLGKGVGGWRIAQLAGQQILSDGGSTSVGVTGSLSSSAQHNGVVLICTTANTTYTILNAQGSLIAA